MAKIDLQHAYRSVPILFTATDWSWQFTGHIVTPLTSMTLGCHLVQKAHQKSFDAIGEAYDGKAWLTCSRCLPRWLPCHSVNLPLTSCYSYFKILASKSVDARCFSLPESLCSLGWNSTPASARWPCLQTNLTSYIKRSLHSIPIAEQPKAAPGPCRPTKLGMSSCVWGTHFLAMHPWHDELPHLPYCQAQTVSWISRRHQVVGFLSFPSSMVGAFSSQTSPQLMCRQMLVQ